MTQQITVLIVEDSPVAQSLLVQMLNCDPLIKVAGVVESAEEAFTFISKIKPDVVILDFELAGVDGLAFTQTVMEQTPIPIICVSSSETPDAASAFDLLEAGALAIIDKPVSCEPESDEVKERLTSTVRAMADVKLVRRRPAKPRSKALVTGERYAKLAEQQAQFELIVIGASTGGPAVLQSILRRMPRDFPVPILVAQHIAPGFLNGFVDWLRSTSRYPIEIARQNQRLERGQAYVCPEGFQTSVTSDCRIRLTDDPPMHGVKPSVSYLFHSAAQAFGKNTVGVLLSGMGKDGAFELKSIRERGGATIAQDAASSIVHGMPGEAIRIGAVGHVVHADRIASLLVKLVTEGERVSAGIRDN
jgi:Chemotaxis response regulator containing a CheY-like receiver domain and a methylesterase domain